MTRVIYYIILLIILLIIYTLDKMYIETYNYIELNDKIIDYYVITMRNTARLENIINQENKINKNADKKIKINLVDAVVGKNLDINKLIEENVVSLEFGNEDVLRKNEIGCYMSHLKIYNIIHEQNISDYTIIFEDDFDIVSENFINDLDSVIKIINDKDFDMLFLGTNPENYLPDIEKNRGELIENNVYNFNSSQYFYGSHAILINNKNISKIIKNLELIDNQIDVKIQSLAMDKKLNIFTLYPIIVDQLIETESTIR